MLGAASGRVSSFAISILIVASGSSPASDLADRERRAWLAERGVLGALSAAWAGCDRASKIAASHASSVPSCDPVIALLMERLQYHLLFRWSSALVLMMRLGILQRSRRAGTGCSKEHCPKFLAHDPGAAQGLEAVVNDHVCVDSTLIDAWALMKASNQSIRRRAARVRRRPGGGRNA